MSAKWKSLQHRHRYTYSSIVFPDSFIETLDLLPLEISSSSSSYFFAQLRQLISLNSTYSQISAVKNLSSSFTQLLATADIPVVVVSTAARLYLEILFLENSLPVHRTLISALAKNRKFLSVISTCLVSLCEEYSGLGKKGKKRFLVSRAALSLMGYPKLGFLNETVEKCSLLVAMDAVAGLSSVISDIDGGSRSSPLAMEQCQEAMSCLYYLLQRFSSNFVGLEDGRSTFESVVRTILSILKSRSFSRECLVAAGVSFCAVIQACISPAELSPFISKGFYGFCDDAIERENLCVKKVLSNVDMYSEIAGFSVLTRLCLLRGMLTSIPRTVLNRCFVEPSNGSVWTILYNGILPELCRYCENPTDSHFNFHVLTVTQICLQQIKTSILAGLTDVSGGYEPLPEDMVKRILRIVWNNLEDPLNQTVKQVHLIFDLLLDIESSLPSAVGSERTKSFLSKTTMDLLRLGPRCKGRYAPLASLTKHLGAKSLLGLNSNLLFETAIAYVDDDVCSAATSFLKCFLECLRDECWSHNGIEKGYETFRGLCLPPLLHGLISGHSKLRSNLNTYALPVMLEVDVDSIFPMLAFISVGPSGEENKLNHVDLKIDQQVAALVSLLKVSRLLALIEGDIDLDHDSLMQKKSSDRVALVHIKGIKVRVIVEWLVLALTHVDESLRIDAAESLFLNPKTSSLPSSLELCLMREAVPLNMRCCSTAFQMKWTSLFRKFFSRVRTALERLVKQGSWQPISSSDEGAPCDGIKDAVFHRAEDLFHFMKWLSCFLCYSCYPSAPYERKTMAMELILIMLDVWPAKPAPQGNHYLYPYSEGFTSPDLTLSLVGSIIDSWDRLRESAFRILLCFPTPLPGISSHESVKEVIKWAKKLACSPRCRESDAGALTLRLIFKKYVSDLGWVVGAGNVVCLDSRSELINGDAQFLKVRTPIVEYILSLIEWLRIVVEEGEKDLLKACRNSFVHGVLLTLRYTFEELDWNSELVLSSSSEMRFLLEKLLELVMRITSLALCVVSSDAWHTSYDMDDMFDEDAFLSDIPIEMDTPESLSEPVDKILKSADNVRQAEQVVMVGCWLAMKEVSLLLGTIIRKIPLPSSTVGDSSKPSYPLSNASEIQEVTDIVLDLKQLETIGNHFLEVLLKMKHNGAIDKTRAGFTALCNRLLCSNDPRLCKMTEAWMQQLMERTIAKGQTVDDLLRRSAGIPAAFIAFFLSEPEGTPKKLLPQALRWLIEVANMSLCNTSDTGSESSEVVHKNSFKNLNGAPMQTIATEMGESGRASKIRDEGVIPTVHAFNVLRAAFNDTNLAVDTSGFCAESLIISIRTFSSPYWEVRNSACLAFTALVRRMIGFVNVQKRESARRALTGLEFFHRYPALHPFLFSELKIATELLEDGGSKHMASNIAKAIHPSLCPILILLSRLKPSLISTEVNDALDPFLFMPFIRKCATQNNLRVRVLASRALTGLVSNEKLQSVLSGVVRGLPYGRHQMALPGAPHLISSSSVNMNNGDETASYCFVSFNSIHGILLQLISLLESNCRNLNDISKKDQILGELIQVLAKCSWIGSIKSCSCPTLNSSYLRVLDQMLGIARTYSISRHAATIKSLLLELSSECLDAESSCGLGLYDPTKDELRRQAAVSYFSCHFGVNQKTSKEDFQLQTFPPLNSDSSKTPESESSVSGLHERIISCISDSTYEVRLAALKWLLLILKSVKPGDDNGIILMWAKNNLQSTLMQLLALEEKPKCVYYILKIIFSWNTLNFEKPSDSQYDKTISAWMMDSDSVFCFWDTLVFLNNTVMHTKTRETLLCCMSICVKHFVRLFRSSVFIDQSEVKGEIVVSFNKTNQSWGWVKFYQCIDSFIILVKQYSAPSEPVNLRKAAAESTVASGLLEEATVVASFVSNNQIPPEELPVYVIDEKKGSQYEMSKVINLYALRILDLWFTCIQLLEDEEVGLRERLAKDVQKCINHRGSRTRDCNNSVPTQVDRVIGSSFEFLSSIFGHWLEYYDYLLMQVLNTASSVLSRGDLVRRIFDKEIDNHHEERLLICQICCSHLEKLSVSKPWAARVPPEGFQECDIAMFFQRWRLRFLRQLISFTKDYIETEGGTDWVGGMGNHKDTFIPLYASLLGLYALMQCPSEGYHSSGQFHMLFSSEFAELECIFRPFLRNPLIANLYFLVLQAHEKMLGDSQAPQPRGDYYLWEDFDPYFLLR